MSTTEIRELARRFSAEQLERCLQEELEAGTNPCVHEGSESEVMNALAKAEFVRERVEQGVPVNEAIRELGRRIRRVQRAQDDGARRRPA